MQDKDGNGRRKGDRRKSQQPYEGPDRRKGNRRSGKDRRETDRSSTAKTGEDTSE